MKPNTPRGGKELLFDSTWLSCLTFQFVQPRSSSRFVKACLMKTTQKEKTTTTKKKQRYWEKQEGKADPVCFLKKDHWKGNVANTGKNRVDGKDTNLDLIPSASVTDALIRQKGNMLFCNTSSYLKPLLLNSADWTWVAGLFLLENNNSPL